MADNSLGAKVGVPVVVPVLTKEYSYNSDVTATALVTASGFVSGTTGVAFSTNWAVGTAYTRRVRFSDVNLDTDMFMLEILQGGLWLPASARLFAYAREIGTNYGPLFTAVSAGSTDLDVTFLEGGYAATGATLGANGTAWSSLNANYNWRVKRERYTVVAYGAGLATSVKSGLYSAGAAPGIKSNVAAAVGDVGQVVQSSVVGVTVAASAGISDITFIDLTEGDWDVSAMAVHNDTTGNTWLKIGISTASTSFAGLINGFNMAIGATGNVAGAGIACVPKVPIRIATGTTVRHYLCGQYSSLNQAVDASIVARRVR